MINSLVCTLEKQDQTGMILSLYDAENSNGFQVQLRDLFTSKKYDADTLKALHLSTEEFAEIGQNLIIRLLALNSELK